MKAPIDRPTVDKLLGAVSKFSAQEGLFVAWGGFKTNVQKELAGSFFKVRLWTQKELLEQLFWSAFISGVGGVRQHLDR